MPVNSSLHNFKQLCLLACLLMLTGCSSLYFRTLEQPPTTPALNPQHWPWQEYWTGIIFNGEKIGFTHQQFSASDGRFRIRSSAALRLRFLMIDKQYSAQTDDIVNRSLALQTFTYTQHIDNSRRRVDGVIEGNILKLNINSADHLETKQIKIDQAPVPMSALYLYPVLHGLQVGKTYEYTVFDAESLSIQRVRQHIEAWQSSELFSAKAFKLVTEVMGLQTETWLDTSGLPHFELSLNGAIISALEDETRAKDYLAQAALSKSEALLAYSRIPVTTPIENPRKLQSLKMQLSGIPESFKLPDATSQSCHRLHDIWQCRIDPQGFSTQIPVEARYTSPSVTVNSNAPRIRKLASEISGSTNNRDTQVNRILGWMEQHIEKAVIDSFNALDVLKQRRAECQGHSMLFAALARSLGIPTRLMNGIVYSDQHEAFLYHTWVESFIGQRWQAIDPTLSQRHVDATHIALIEGEELSDLVGLIPLIGKLEVRLTR